MKITQSFIRKYYSNCDVLGAFNQTTLDELTRDKANKNVFSLRRYVTM